MNKTLSTLLLSASLLTAPLSLAASAAPEVGYQVASASQATQAHITTHKKHHRLRNTALVVGGALVARHMIRKHRQQKPTR